MRTKRPIELPTHSLNACYIGWNYKHRGYTDPASVLKIVFLYVALAWCCSVSVVADGDDKVFMGYTEAQLDDAYDQRVWADNIGEVLAHLHSRNESALARIGDPERHDYGEGAMEQLDWYRSDDPNAPIHIHFHGGAWIVGEARSNAYIAEASLKAGAHVVIPEYIKVNAVDGDLMPLARQSREAVAWVYRNAARFDADPERILVSGHSAGGHLAAVVLTTDWSEYDLPGTIVKQGVLVSAMFDLYPVSLSSRNEYVAFTDHTVDALSPIRHLDNLEAELVLAYGSNESPEFQRQTLDFATALQNRGTEVRLIEATDLNHFEIVEDFSLSKGTIGSVVVELLRSP